MKVELLFGRMCLSFRGGFSFPGIWDDPRGLTGSELGFVRIGEELAALGHEVTLRTVSGDATHGALKVASIDEPCDPCDLVVSINEPDLLRKAPVGAKRVCMFWLNEVSFCKAGFADHVDLFCSPSAGHLEQVMNNPKWREVERSPEHPAGKGFYDAPPAKWTIVPLGCDPERFDYARDRHPQHGEAEQRGFIQFCKRCGNPVLGTECAPAIQKVPGSVIYCSSPDRGLHWLLQEWPAIKRAVPHATLQIFYRLADWLPTFDQTDYFPPIEPNRAIVNYVRECLRRFQDVGGLGVTIRDSVSRNEIQRAMASAEALAYPCDTMSWSEGFSCSILECCAARACPITTNCDALGSVYGEALPLVDVTAPDWVATWREQVIKALTDEAFRNDANEKARKLAEGLTWRRAAEQLLAKIQERLGT
jgi:glycosyltransferase involved in cell wall biosynthesis